MMATYTSSEMHFQEISIQVPQEVAQAFRAASEDERRLAIRVFAGFLKPRSKKQTRREFDCARKAMGAEAAKSGLTPGQLDEILANDN